MFRTARPDLGPASPRHHADAAAGRIFSIAGVTSIAGLAVLGLLFQYRGALGEPDLYRVVASLLEGHASGQGARSPMQYGRSFSFGYYELLYGLLDEAVLTSPDRLMAVINTIGFVSAIAALALLFVAVRTWHGPRVAFVTAALFGLSPMVLDLTTSGHPVLPSLAAYGLGVALMSRPSTGVLRLVLWALASLAFLVGLTIRAEILIALGWPVVAGADTASLARFLRSAALRALPAVLAVAAFFVAQAGYVESGSGGGAGTLLAFMRTFYSLGQIGKGMAFLAIGFGSATLILAASAAVVVLRRSPQRSIDRARLAIALLLEPAALILPCLVLWLPNPNPARHFLFALLGTALFIGLVLERTKPRPASSVLLVLAAIVGNQLIGEFSRPAVISALKSPYTNFPDRPRTLTQAPLGALWVHHASLVQRRAALDTEAARLPTFCDRQVIVLTIDPMQMVLALYRDGHPPRLSETKLGPFDAISAVRPNGQTFFLVPRYPYWPRDVVAEIIAMPALASFAIWDVPLSRSIYDRTPVPRNRMPRDDCPA